MRQERLTFDGALAMDSTTATRQRLKIVKGQLFSQRQCERSVMADPIEDLIREIAAKHGIAVSRDDRS